MPNAATWGGHVWNAKPVARENREGSQLSTKNLRKHVSFDIGNLQNHFGGRSLLAQ